MEDENTMEKVLNTFDGLWDNTTNVVSGVASDAGNAAGTVAEKAVDAIGVAGDFVGDNVENVFTFAKGLFGN